MQLTYREYPASMTLRPYVDRYWTHESDGDSQAYSPLQRCLPKGMSEWLFQVGSIHLSGVVNVEWKAFPQTYLVGVTNEPVFWRMPGSSTIFGVQLKPECLIQLFHLQLADFVNQYVLPENFLGNQAKMLTEQICNVPSTKERIAIVENFLLAKLAKSKFQSNYFSEAMKQIRGSGGLISIETLSKNLFVCERQLQRVFKLNLGISPKTYQRIIRFNNIYNEMLHGRQASWAELAQAYAYADQAHFIRDFKHFTGATPNAVLTEIIDSTLAPHS